MSGFEIILLGLAELGVAVAGYAILRRVRRQVDSTRVLEDGQWRELTYQERMAVGYHFATTGGRWLWLLMIAGILLVLICGCVLWYLGIFANPSP